MTVFVVRNNQIINGVLPEIPFGTTELDCISCFDLKTITNIPSTVKKANFFGCKKLRNLPELLEGIEELNCRDCENLEIITNIPSSVRKANFFGCKKLRNLPELLEGIEELNCSYCENLEIITNIPSSVRKAIFFACKKLRNLPELLEGIEELNCSYCENLEIITNIPSSVRKAIFAGCVKITNLPELLEGIEELNLRYCTYLKTITNIPSTVKNLNLDGCNKFEFYPKLLEQLQELEYSGCQIRYPERFFTNRQLYSSTQDTLRNVIKNYKTKNSEVEAKFPSLQELVDRFLTENVLQRGGISSITSNLVEALETLEHNPNLLPLFETISEIYNTACVNQPVGGWLEIASFAAINQQESISQKLEAAKQLLTLELSKEFISKLEDTKKPRIGVEIEAGNALFKKAYKEFEQHNLLKTKWLGVPQLIAYERTIKSWLTNEVFQEFLDKVSKEVLSLCHKEIADKICESQHQITWGEICFPNQMAKIRESFKEKEETLRNEYNELSERFFEENKSPEDSKSLSEIAESLKNLSNDRDAEMIKKSKELTFRELTIFSKFLQNPKAATLEKTTPKNHEI